MITISMSPIAFTIGAVSVRWYGVMIALGVLMLVLWMLREVRRGAKLSYDTIITVALVSIPSAIIISRLLYVIDRWVYVGDPGPIWGFEGLTIWGAVLGATLGIWVYSRFSKFPFGYFVDLVALPAILAQALGRVGCTINGCCYGLPTSLPWGIVYTAPQSYAPLGVAVHPTQLYEIVFLLMVFGVLFALRKRFQPDGSLFLIYLSVYSLWRLGIDFIRDGTPFLFGLHQAQVIGIVVLLITVPILILRTRWVKTPRSA
ncbi:MAG: prolipoprotein diacylglyceryl transferase [Chloroflexi bacterium]|nr:prolipoprotein diacylglyceryl transferase [Chloroflexota bacterium]